MQQYKTIREQTTAIYNAYKVYSNTNFIDFRANKHCART